MRTIWSLSLLLAASAAAQTFNVNQIRPSTTNGQVITTVTGHTVWATPSTGSGTVPAIPVVYESGIQTSANQLFAAHVVPVAVTVPTSCTGSAAQAFASTFGGSVPTATGSVAWTFRDLTTSTTLCTFTWSASGSVAVVTGSGGTINAGDAVGLVGATTADATLANVGAAVNGTAVGGGSSGFPFILGSTSIAALSTNTAVTGLSVNGVTLNGAGSSSLFLNQAGGYTTPPGSTGNVNAPSTLTNNAVMIGQGTTQAATIAVDNTAGDVLIATAGAPVMGPITPGMVPTLNQSTTSYAAGLAGGALGSVPYQTVVNTTGFVASPTTASHQFFYGWAPSGSALAPTAVDLGVYLNANLTATSPLVLTPTALGWVASCPTCPTSATGSTVSVNGGLTIASPNFNGTTPAAGAGNQNVIFQQSGSSVSAEVPLGVTSFTGDGNFLTNSASTGAVTTTLHTAVAHTFWGNNTGSTAAPGYQAIGTADLPTIPLTKLANQSPDTFLINATGSAASPTAVTMPTGGTNGCAGGSDAIVYNNSSHAVGCNTSLITSFCHGTTTISSTTIASAGTLTATPVTCTGLAAGDNIALDFNSDPTGIVGFQPSTSGMLTIIKWPSSGQINIKIVNNTSAPITMGTIILDYTGEGVRP